MRKHSILIADDHSMIRDGIKALLKETKEAEVTGEAVTGLEAVEKYRQLKPDLVIMDISMPGLNGMEASKQILAEDPAAHILVLSMYDDEDYISQCIEYGVKGFVIKNESGNELGSAIHAVLNGEQYLSKRVQQVIVNRFTSGNKKQKKHEPEVKLTSREVEIVKLIAEGFTSHQMADKLFISPRTVETHRANLMKKLSAKNAVELVKKVTEMGHLN